MCPKVNVMAQLEFELAYYDPAVHRFNHYATTTHTPLDTWFWNINITGIVRFGVVGALTRCTLLYFLWTYTLRIQIGHNVAEAIKNIWSKVPSITVQTPDGPKNFVRVVRTSMIRENQVGLESWIPKPCSQT